MRSDLLPKRSLSQAHLEESTYEQIVFFLEKELESNGLEALDELQLNTVAQHATKFNPEKTQPLSHHCEKPGHYRNQWRQLKSAKDQTRGTKNNAGTKNNGQTNSNPYNNKTPKKAIITIQTTEIAQNSKLFTHYVRTVTNGTTPQKKANLEPTQQIDLFFGIEDRRKRVRINDSINKTTQKRMFRLQRRK